MLHMSARVRGSAGDVTAARESARRETYLPNFPAGRMMEAKLGVGGGGGGGSDAQSGLLMALDSNQIYACLTELVASFR